MATRILLPLVSFAAAAFAAGNVFLWKELSEEQQRGDDLHARLSELAASRASIQAPAPIPSPAPAKSEPAGPVIAPPAAPSVESREALMAQQAAMKSQQDRRTRLMADPRYREEIRRHYRQGINVHRSLAIDLLGMSEADADAALDLWADFESQRRNRHVEITSHEQMRAQREAEDAAYEASLAALLGEQQAAKWKHYRDSLPTRMRVTQLQSRLDGGDILREDQIEPLIEAMDVEQSKLRRAMKQRNDGQMQNTASGSNGATEFLAQEIEMYSDNKKRVLAAAAPHLSSAQLAHLDAMYEQEIEGRRSQLRMRQMEAKILADSATPSN